MEIKSISNSQLRTESSSSSKSSSKSGSSSTDSDKIEISAEGKKISTGTVEAKDLSAVEKNIKDGFYNTEEVITKVASAILKLLSK